MSSAPVNVLFLGVARLAGQGYVVASFSYKNNDVDIAGVKEVLEQPNTNLVPGKHYNFSEVDKLSAVSKKVDSVKLVMQENVDLALANCVKLEAIEDAAQNLQQQAGVFNRNAKALKDKMWWKNIKMKLIIGFIILAILGIIIGVAVAMSKANK